MKLKISMVTKNGSMCFSISLEIEKYFYISKADKYKICNENITHVHFQRWFYYVL